MKKPELVRLLLHKAGQDEAVLAELLHNPKFDDETVGFHAQQAVEKLLKAWLAHLGVDYPKVHNLESLLDLLEASGQRLPVALADLEHLTPFATVWRYEDLPLSTSFDRDAALELVRKIRAFVEAQIAGTQR
jgi:HEPN domain-containing protein